jgi:hypothetical protein
MCDELLGIPNLPWCLKCDTEFISGFRVKRKTRIYHLCHPCSHRDDSICDDEERVPIKNTIYEIHSKDIVDYHYNRTSRLQGGEGMYYRNLYLVWKKGQQAHNFYLHVNVLVKILFLLRDVSIHDKTHDEILHKAYVNDVKKDKQLGLTPGFKIALTGNCYFIVDELPVKRMKTIQVTYDEIYDEVVQSSIEEYIIKRIPNTEVTMKKDQFEKSA